MIFIYIFRLRFSNKQNKIQTKVFFFTLFCVGACSSLSPLLRHPLRSSLDDDGNLHSVEKMLIAPRRSFFLVFLPLFSSAQRARQKLTSSESRGNIDVCKVMSLRLWCEKKFQTDGKVAEISMSRNISAIDDPLPSAAALLDDLDFIESGR